MIVERQGMRIDVQGAVQGVGFRPFVYRLAHELKLTGQVSNTVRGVSILLDGVPDALEQFLVRLQCDKPPLARITQLKYESAPPAGYIRFEIQSSRADGQISALVLPDVATCPDCLHDITDPHNRRYLYPFTNCTNCGPRYSIIEALPYDRARTSMHDFTMCPACRAEYENPLDRRFHAQPNACPVCGPHLELWNPQGRALALHHDALLAAAEAIRRGEIVALKGLGGFQLLVDARDEDAVRRLRERKYRPDKPFAVMYPSIELVQQQCPLTPQEADLLKAHAAPIVLLRAGEGSVAHSVAPENPYLGVMLPYTPLHHLLMRELGFPVVATSGNLSDEPICIDEQEALARLSGLADLFLVHNRPIVRQVDDSVVRVVAGQAQVLRRARGYAPFPVEVPQPLPDVLALGGQQKNTIAVSAGGDKVFLSQHIGDLETAGSFEVFQRTINDFRTLYDWSPAVIAHDLHPDYVPTHYVAELPQPRTEVQHHYAHVLACMAENQISAPALGICWDGTGYGSDGMIWGGEWLLVRDETFERVAHLRQFQLPGGEEAVREPRRVALALLYELYDDACIEMAHLAPVRSLTEVQRRVLYTMLRSRLNAPATTSMGRLFDGVAALLGLCQQTSFEGQAAMALEFAIEASEGRYAFGFKNGIVDWEPMLRSILDDLRLGRRTGEIAAKFHNTLAELIVALAWRVDQAKVVLTGGCFQNRYLTERTIERLRSEGFEPYWHQQVPPNDGGIALGQVIAAAREYRSKGPCV